MSATRESVEQYRTKHGYRCGFCQSGNHERCPRAVRNGDLAKYKIIICDCKETPACGDTSLRCLECKSEAQQDIDPGDWRCLDRDACEARIEARLKANPAFQKIREVRKTAMARVANEKAEKAVKSPKSAKVGTCLVTGKPTKGGKFLPGMDARFVSLRVAAVINGDETAAQARKQFSDNELSDALLAKFERSLELAQEKAAKKADAAKAKADKPVKKAAAKKAAAK